VSQSGIGQPSSDDGTRPPSPGVLAANYLSCIQIASIGLSLRIHESRALTVSQKQEPRPEAGALVFSTLWFSALC